jgi:hypothetical protein
MRNALKIVEKLEDDKLLLEYLIVDGRIILK